MPVFSLFMTLLCLRTISSSLSTPGILPSASFVMAFRSNIPKAKRFALSGTGLSNVFNIPRSPISLNVGTLS